MPLLQRDAVGTVDFNRREQRVAAALGQPAVQAFGETAEVLILAVAQRQHRVVQVSQRQGLAEQRALEASGTVGCLTVTESTHNEQGIVALLQILRRDVRQALHTHRQPRRL